MFPLRGRSGCMPPLRRTEKYFPGLVYCDWVPGACQQPLGKIEGPWSSFFMAPSLWNSLVSSHHAHFRGAVPRVPSSFMSPGCGRQKPQSLLSSPSFLVPPFLFYYFSFGARVLYCNPGWPVAHSIHGHSSASASVCSDGRCEPLYRPLPLLRHIS